MHGVFWVGAVFPGVLVIKMRTIFLLRGLPASTKSTFAKELLKKEPNRFKRVNRDDLRLMFDDGVYDKNKEEFIRQVQDALIRSSLKAGFDVIVDNTHLVPMTVKKLHKLAESVGDVKVIEKCFNVSVDECLRRNALREGKARVPDKVIIDMAHGAGLDKGRKLEDKESYYPPVFVKQEYVHDESLPKAILCDLDGTLAIMGDRSPYDASQCDVKDMPNWPVINCVKAMYHTGHNIVFMSGREDKDRAPTVRFIEKYVTEPCESNCHTVDKAEQPIPYELYMRPTGDQRKDSLVKGELFEQHVAMKYNVQFILDDRQQVVDFWRNELGLITFQVAPGDF